MTFRSGFLLLAVCFCPLLAAQQYPTQIPQHKFDLPAPATMPPAPAPAPSPPAIGTALQLSRDDFVSVMKAQRTAIAELSAKVDALDARIRKLEQ